MSTLRDGMAGRRGWAAVLGLSTVLGVVVLGQLPAAAQEAPLSLAALQRTVLPSITPAALVPELTAPASVTGPARPASTPAAAAVAVRPVTTSAADRLPGSKPPNALRQASAAAVAPVTEAPPAAAPAPAPARAAAPADSRCSGDGWQQRRGQAALASLKAGAERTGFRVEFKGARKGYMGLTHLKERRIEMFVRACGTQSDELLRHVMAHELGHAYDTTHMTTAERRAWQVARGIPLSTPWYGCSGCSDFATPAGDYAEVYAQWARGSSTNRSQLAGDVPPAQLAQLAREYFGA